MKENDLSGVYEEISYLIGGTYFVQNGAPSVSIGSRILEIPFDTDGLMHIWNEHCKGWAWSRSLKGQLFAGRIDKLPYVDELGTGNFHADFARLLAAVLKECK